MIALLCFVLVVLVSPFKSRSRLEAENAVLRHQLIVLRRRVQGRVRLTNGRGSGWSAMRSMFPRGSETDRRRGVTAIEPDHGKAGPEVTDMHVKISELAN